MSYSIRVFPSPQTKIKGELVRIVSLRNAGIDNCNIRKQARDEALNNNFKKHYIMQHNWVRKVGPKLMKSLAM